MSVPIPAGDMARMLDEFDITPEKQIEMMVLNHLEMERSDNFAAVDHGSFVEAKLDTDLRTRAEEASAYTGLGIDDLIRVGLMHLLEDYEATGSVTAGRRAA